MTLGSCVFPQLSLRLARLPVWCRQPWPLPGGGSKVGSKTTARGLRVPHDTFLTGLQMAGDSRQLCRRWLAGCIAHRIRSFLFLTGEGNHVSFHTLTICQVKCKWRFWIFFSRRRKTPLYTGRPVIRCRLISACFLLLSQPVMTNGSFRSLSQVFSTLNSI